MSRENDLVHINYLTPKPGFLLMRGMFRYAAEYMNIDQAQLMSSIRGRSNSHSLDTGQIVEDKFHFGSPELSLQHFITAQKTSRAIIKGTVETFGLPTDRFDQKTEVDIPDPDIARMVLYTNPKSTSELPEGTVLDTRFETLRELFLVRLALQLDTRAIQECSYARMSELQLLFNKNLYYGPAGYTRLITKYISFNPEHGIERISDTDFPGATKIEDKMRFIDGINVQINFDKKSAARQITKSLVDYLQKGKTKLDLLHDPNGKPSLQDRQRFSFVVDGGHPEIARVHQKMLSCANFENIERIPIHTDNGQNPTVKDRFVGIYGGIPMEIMYYDVEGYQNSCRHIGIKNSDGLYTGSNHELFAIRRSKEILPLFFPFEVYGKENQSPSEYRGELMDFARRKSEQVARNLREE